MECFHFFYVRCNIIKIYKICVIFPFLYLKIKWSRSEHIKCVMSNATLEILDDYMWYGAFDLFSWELKKNIIFWTQILKIYSSWFHCGSHWSNSGKMINHLVFQFLQRFYLFFFQIRHFFVHNRLFFSCTKIHLLRKLFTGNTPSVTGNFVYCTFFLQWCDTHEIKIWLRILCIQSQWWSLINYERTLFGRKPRNTNLFAKKSNKIIFYL